jgi:hypothetical protein
MTKRRIYIRKLTFLCIAGKPFSIFDFFGFGSSEFFFYKLCIVNRNNIIDYISDSNKAKVLQGRQQKQQFAFKKNEKIPLYKSVIKGAKPKLFSLLTFHMSEMTEC